MAITSPTFRLVLFLFLLHRTCPLCAQSTPQALAATVVQRWCLDSQPEFEALYPFREGRDAWSQAIASHAPRKPGLSEVIRLHGDQAVLLLSAVPIGFNSGSDTTIARGFSGVYEAYEYDGRWSLKRAIPLETMGKILSHHMRVAIQPAFGIASEDRMHVQIMGGLGLAMRLNHAARIKNVSVGGRPVRYLFAGGLLWIDLPDGDAELTIRYSLEVEEGPNYTDSGSFLRKAGHLRTSYFWHPFFNFNSTGDLADFDIDVSIPRQYHVSTSIPQEETVNGSIRTIQGRTVRPTSALVLVYDRDWVVTRKQFGQTELQLFLTPQFQPSGEAVEQEFGLVYKLLTERFGVPKGGYLGVVESRSKSGNGWQFAANQIVVGTGWPRLLASKAMPPRAYLGHEISHLWTHGAGPAANFLQEGWATYAESLILQQEFGPGTVDAFWNAESENYFSNFEGKASLLEDNNDEGVAYAKGAWLFRMLEESVGTDAFDKAIAEYSRRSLVQPSGWEVLAECMQHEAPAGFNARAFLQPWLAGTHAPEVTAEIRDHDVILRQTGAFILPLTVEAETPDGVERQHVLFQGKEVSMIFAGRPSSVKIDPDHLLLLRR